MAKSFPIRVIKFTLNSLILHLSFTISNSAKNIRNAKLTNFAPFIRKIKFRENLDLSADEICRIKSIFFSS